MPWFARMTLLVTVLSLPFAIYIGLRLSAAFISQFMFSKKKVRIIVFSVLLWVYLLPIIYILYSLNGNIGGLFIFNPQLQWKDYMFLYPFWWGIIVILEIATYFLAMDVLNLLPPVRSKIKWTNYFKIGIVVFFAFYVGIRFYLDTDVVTVSTSKIALKNLPSDFQGLRIALIGDIHFDRYTQERKLEKLKQTIQSGDNDILLFTGDLISRGRKYLLRSLKIVKNPQAKLASLACMGDHDFWSDAYNIPIYMEDRGWIHLQDQHHLIPYKGKNILVTGITQVYSQRISRSNFKKLLAQSPTADLKIVLVHQPSEFIIEVAATSGYHLVLAGHTHGGQIVIRPFGIPLTPNQSETQYYQGIYQVKDLKAVVTNGIGLTLAPVRYHAPAEITKLILVQDK